LTLRRGIGNDVSATRLCSSTRSGLVPSTAANTTVPPAVKLESPPGSRSGRRPPRVRLRPSRRCRSRRSTRSVLGGPQDPELLLPVALQVEDGVDHVLEDARPGERALLSRADQEDRDPVSLASRIRRAAHSRTWLTVPAAASRPGSVMVWMESTMATPGAAARMASMTVSRSFSPGPGAARGPRQAGARGARPADRLLSGRVEHGCLGGDLAGEVHDQGRLADPGLAADQDQAAGHDAAAEHPVQLAPVEDPAGRGVGADLGQRDGPRRAAGTFRPPARRASTTLNSESVSRPAVRALPRPAK